MGMISCFTKDVTLGGIKIKANQQVCVAIDVLHRNPD